MIHIKNLHVHFRSSEGTVHAVRGVNIKVERGQFYTLLGPSGCGKTTTLRCLAGLERPSSAEISIDGQVVFSSQRNLLIPPYRRDIGMVFQSYAIWPHMTVFENVAFPLRGRARPQFSARRDAARRCCGRSTLVQLTGYEAPAGARTSRAASSSAWRSRARWCASRKVLLLDEPLSNLDAKLREEMRTELRDLLKRLGITTVYVTHDQIEALTMSDMVAVMDQGEIVQEASPIVIYREPKVRFVADFIGLTNFIKGSVHRAANGNALGEVQTASGLITCILPDKASSGDKVLIVIRPEDLNLVPGPVSAGSGNIIEGRVSTSLFMGDSTEFRVAIKDTMLRLKLHSSTAMSQGDTVRIELPPERCRALMG